jgi:hypothetical protein
MMAKQLAKVLKYQCYPNGLDNGLLAQLTKDFEGTNG